MHVKCITTLASAEERINNEIPYIAKLTYTGKGIIEEDKFHVGELSLISNRNVNEIIATNFNVFNEGDVIKVSGLRKINNKSMRDETFMVKNDGLLEIEVATHIDNMEAATWAICVAKYVDEYMSKHLKDNQQG